MTLEVRILNVERTRSTCLSQEQLDAVTPMFNTKIARHSLNDKMLARLIELKLAPKFYGKGSRKIRPEDLKNPVERRKANIAERDRRYLHILTGHINESKLHVKKIHDYIKNIQDPKLKSDANKLLDSLKDATKGIY